MKKVIGYWCFILFLPLYLYAQPTSLIGLAGQNNLTEFGQGNAGNVVQPFNNRANTITGSPFWYTEWAAAVVLHPNGKLYTSTSANYDAWKDEFIFKQTDGQYLSIFPTQIKKFELKISSDSSKTPCQYTYLAPDKNYEVSGFFQILHEGKKLSFLVKHRITLEKASSNSAYTNSTQLYDNFQAQADRYYLLNLEKNTLAKIKKREKQVLAFIEPKFADQIKQYIKTNKLSLHNEKDIVTLLKFYETL